jgi:protein subunit release factor B
MGYTMARPNTELIFSATKKDFKIDWFSGQGAGGQHRNKHQNCCRITHPVSGLVGIGQNHRSRVSNQRDAFNSVCDQLIEHYELNKKQKHDVRSDVTVRTYHEPRNVVKDHVSGFEQEYKTVVIDGEITEMVEARKRALMGKE